MTNYDAVIAVSVELDCLREDLSLARDEIQIFFSQALSLPSQAIDVFYMQKVVRCYNSLVIREESFSKALDVLCKAHGVDLSPIEF
jgi:hypothetical protein